MADTSFRVTTSLPDRQPGLNSLSSGNAPAWRKALEDAAWRDAFGATRPFEAGQNAVAELANSGRSAEKSPLFPRLAPLVEQVIGQASGGMSASAKANDTILPVVQARPHDSHEACIRGDEASPLLRQQMAGRFTTLQPSSWPTGHLQRLGVRCPVRNMTTTSLADGVAVWIRDAHATPVQVMALLGPLRKTMGEVGAQVLRVSLNGSHVWSAALVRPTIPQVKE